MGYISLKYLLMSPPNIITAHGYESICLDYKLHYPMFWIFTDRKQKTFNLHTNIPDLTVWSKVNQVSDTFCETKDYIIGKHYLEGWIVVTICWLKGHRHSLLTHTLQKSIFLSNLQGWVLYEDFLGVWSTQKERWFFKVNTFVFFFSLNHCLWSKYHIQYMSQSLRIMFWTSSVL